VYKDEWDLIAKKARKQMKLKKHPELDLAISKLVFMEDDDDE